MVVEDWLPAEESECNVVYEVSIYETQPHVGTVVCRSRVRNIQALKLEILNPKSSAPVILVNLIPVLHPSCCASEGVFEDLVVFWPTLLACWAAPGGTSIPTRSSFLPWILEFEVPFKNRAQYRFKVGMNSHE